MFRFVLLLGAMFLLQGVLSVIQMRYFSQEFVKLRRKGKVACGRKSGGFHAGAIVMLLVLMNAIMAIAGEKTVT